MLSLCEVLGITVNDLLSGEKGMITIIAISSLIVIAAYIELPTIVRIGLIVFSIAAAAGIVAAVVKMLLRVQAWSFLLTQALLLILTMKRPFIFAKIWKN